MYARLINLSFGSDVAHDQAHALYQALLQEFRGVDGFRGCNFMLMANARRGLILTFWDDERSASAAGERVLPRIVERMRGLLAEAPEVTGYEVIDHLMFDVRQPPAR